MSRDLKHIGLFLKDIYFHNKKGQLIFAEEHVHKYFYFTDGCLVHTKTNRKDELLGEVLYRLGKLSEEAYSKIDDFIEPGKSIGTVLVENELISKESLAEGLGLQMKEVILNVFPRFNGKFRFRNKEDLEEQEFETKLSIPNLILEGIRRMDYHSSLREFMRQNVIVPKENEHKQELSKNEKKLWGMIKANSTTEELFNSTRLDPEFFWKSLYLFYCLDLIEMEGEEKLEPTEEKKRERKVRDDKKKMEEFREFSLSIPEMDYYQILGIPQDASPEIIKKAYFNLARKYHPDIFRGDKASKEKAKIDEVFSLISKAYNTLSDVKKRGDYDDQLASPREEKRKDVKRDAEVKFRQGKTLYDQGRYEESLLYLEQAVRLWQGRASYFILLAMSQEKLPEYVKKAEKNFLKAQELEAWNPDSYIRLGMMYKKEGLFIKARKQFEKALQIDPGNRVVLKELGISRKKKIGLKDILSMDIFGKKKK